MHRNLLHVVFLLGIGIAMAGPRTALAQAEPRSFKASPEVYKVLAENEQYRIIEATWKPGQRDAWHSHGKVVATYNLSSAGCTFRLHTPDGKFAERKTRAGMARISTGAPSHYFENIGKTECKTILFESK